MPGIWNYPMAAAQAAIREGVSADLAYDVLSALGSTVSRADFGTLYGQAEVARAMVGPTGELERDQLPGAEFIQPRRTVTATGYMYQLWVSAIDRETGAVVDIPYGIKLPYLITPGEAIDSAIVSQTLRAGDYNLDVLDAQLTGVYSLEPMEA